MKYLLCLTLLLCGLTAKSQNLCLQSEVSDPTRLQMMWLAPGDDGLVGLASLYDIRTYSLPIDSTNWHLAVSVDDEPTPDSAGSEQCYEFTDLVANQMHYYSIRTADEVPNWSTIGSSVGFKVLTGQPSGYCDLISIFKGSDDVLRVQPFISNGSLLSLDVDGYWAKSGFTISDKSFTIMCNINNDDYDDVVIFSDYGKQGGKDVLSMYYWAYNGNTLNHIGTLPWSKLSGYPVENVHSVVSGDFDNDGFVDDVSAFYNYSCSPKCVAAFHMWLSDGQKLVYQGSNGWWKVAGYPVENVHSVVSGDFDGDGFVDDIAILYDYGAVNGKSVAAFHMWLSDGQKLVYQGSNGWWKVAGYPVENVHSVVSGDFDGDGVYDVMALYKYQNKTTAHVWKSTTQSFTYQGSNGWFTSSTYNADNVQLLLPGYFTESKQNVAVAQKVAGSIESNVLATEGEYIFRQNYPNPFNPSTIISFYLPRPANVVLTIYNILGQKVVELENGEVPAGETIIEWDASRYASGIYFSKLEISGKVFTKKLVLLK